MECPTATKISIQLVQYGRLTPSDDLCPANVRYPGPSPSLTSAKQEQVSRHVNYLKLIPNYEASVSKNELGKYGQL